MKNQRKKYKIKSAIATHIINNKKEYIIMLLLFIIGIFLGVLFINNVKEEQFNNISDYINNFVDKIKNADTINTANLIKSSMLENFLLVLALWFFGTTVIRNTNSFWFDYI
ncbi:MAG: hypothetical protein IJH76_03060 [Clostridia bacterium]|nr:hypothetical protein [Clostridia bacterium]